MAQGLGLTSLSLGLQVERCWLLTAGGGSVELAPSLKGMPSVAPTFTPAANDRTHTTRATANADRRARPMQEVRAPTTICKV